MNNSNGPGTDGRAEASPIDLQDHHNGQSQSVFKTFKRLHPYIYRGAVAGIVGAVVVGGFNIVSIFLLTHSLNTPTPGAGILNTDPNQRAAASSSKYGGTELTLPRSEISSNSELSSDAKMNYNDFLFLTIDRQISAITPVLAARREQSLGELKKAVDVDTIQDPRIKVAQQISDNIRADVVTASKAPDLNTRKNLMTGPYNVGSAASDNFLPYLNSATDLSTVLGSFEVTQASDFYTTDKKIGVVDTLGYPTMRLKGKLQENSGKTTDMELLIQRYPDKQNGGELDGVMISFLPGEQAYNTGNDNEWRPPQ